MRLARATAFGLVAAALATGDLGAQAEDSLRRFAGLGHVFGDSAAPIHVVEFVDMGCKECRRFSMETFQTIHAEYVETGRAFWQVVPYVSGQPNGEQGARAVECAADQDAFWAMHDTLFVEQTEWWTKMRPQRQFGRYARALGLDSDRFGDCYRDRETVTRTERNTAAALEAGVRATPTFFINGAPVLGALPAAVFRQALEAGGGRTP